MTPATPRLTAMDDLARLATQLEVDGKKTIPELLDELTALRLSEATVRQELEQVRFEKNGIRLGERVCRPPHKTLGTVVRISADGVGVLWDDMKMSSAGPAELVWDEHVAHNAYCLQVVRPDVERLQTSLATLRAFVEKVAAMKPGSCKYDFCLSTASQIIAEARALLERSK